MPNLIQYQGMSDGALIEAAEYERPSPELVAALAERLGDLVDEIVNSESRNWELENESTDDGDE